MLGVGFHRERLCLLLFLLFAIPPLGCANLMKPHTDVLPIPEQCAEALEAAMGEKDKNSTNNGLLYYMRLATYQQTCGRFDESAATFETAKRMADDNYTKSVSAEGLSLMINDATRPYQGENFERALLRVYNALNYAALGDDESAMVEARQVDFFLRELNQAQGGKNVYSEDSFGRYLTGMLHEDSGDIDSARISYFKALESYGKSFENDHVPVPQALLASAMRMAEQLDATAVEKVRSYGVVTPRDVPAGAGEVVFVHQFGRIPDKVDSITQISWAMGFPAIQHFGENDDDAEVQQVLGAGATLAGARTFRVAFPKLVERDYSVTGIGITAPGSIYISRPELVQNLGAIARRDLADRITRIRLRTIARSAVYFAIKELALKAVRERGGNPLQEIAVRAAFVGRDLLFEHADRRQWDSLPDKVQLVHVVLPEGEHPITVDFKTDTGQIVRSERLHVHVRPGKRTYIVMRTAQ